MHARNKHVVPHTPLDPLTQPLLRGRSLHHAGRIARVESLRGPGPFLLATCPLILVSSDRQPSTGALTPSLALLLHSYK